MVQNASKIVPSMTFKQLSANQRQAASFLAEGLSYEQTATLVNVSTKTISRWVKIPDFAEEVEARRALLRAEASIDAAKRATTADFDLVSAIAKMRESRQVSQGRIKDCGMEILEKCSARLQDLPPEAFGPRDLAALFRAAKDLLAWAYEVEPANIDLDQLIQERIGPGSLHAQKVEMGVNAAIDRMFQEIAASQSIPDEYKVSFYQAIGRVDGAPVTLEAQVSLPG